MKARAFVFFSIAFAAPAWPALVAPLPAETLDRVETTGIDARSGEKPVPGARTVDAVHRSVLVRFPDAYEAARRGHGKGYAIERAEIRFAYSGYETSPAGYVVRPSPRWKAEPPSWHLVGWALKHPDDPSDRYARVFGPEELSAGHPNASIDVTDLFGAADFGPDAPTRARSFARNGLVFRKLESYDSRYRDEGDAYDWAVATGGHGLTFERPVLVLTWRRAADPIRGKPWPAWSERATDDRAAPPRRETTIAAEPFAAAAARLSIESRMPAGWQRDRVKELAGIGGGDIGEWASAVERRDYAQYQKLVRETLATPPRYWKGWSIHDDLLLWHTYGEILSPLVRDHMIDYWKSWLMPDIPTSDLFHPQSKEAFDYWKRTGDWRGRSSFFRDGYNYTTSTQNFNHTAAMGALLGGDVIGSRYAIEDGRHGLEAFPLRLWGFLDGGTQELLDHYYLSITLSGQKMFADFGPTAMDRLMGRILLDRTMEMLASAYHPNLRRVIGSSGRTNLQDVLLTQEGIQEALHTLSRRGTLKYLDRPLDAKVAGMRLWGQDLPPGRVAVQALHSRWAPEWYGDVVDDKSFPWEETSTETTRGAFKDPPLWRRVYLGAHYGLASQDIRGGSVDLLAQWNSRKDASDKVEDLGALTMRYVVNDCDLATTHGGTMQGAGAMWTFQSRNRAIVFMKPRKDTAQVKGLLADRRVRLLGSAIALWNFGQDPDLEIHLDGRPVKLPARAKSSDVITIRHGVTYLAILPLHATDLGRSSEVVIGPGCGGRSEPNGAPLAPALTIVSANLQDDAGIAAEDIDWESIASRSYNGFVLEMGDVAEYPTFDAFERRIRDNRVVESWDAASKILSVSYRSGTDLLEAGFSTSIAQADAHFGVTPGEQRKAIPFRWLNGQWPYLPPGLDRDTPVAQQGTSGKLEKNGAVLRTDPGRKAYLLVDIGHRVVTGYNPLPDPTRWSLAVPGGLSVEADGKVGLMKVTVHPGPASIAIDYAPKPEQSGPEMAKWLLVRGAVNRPSVVLNGKAVAPEAIEGTTNSYRIPILP